MVGRHRKDGWEEGIAKTLTCICNKRISQERPGLV